MTHPGKGLHTKGLRGGQTSVKKKKKKMAINFSLSTYLVSGVFLNTIKYYRLPTYIVFKVIPFYR